MSPSLRKVINYITRGWEDEPKPPHPMLKWLPPFVFDVLAFLMLVSILHEVGRYILKIL